MISYALFLCLLPVFAVGLQIPAPDGDLHVYALPVGQGDATVIQCPTGTGGLTVVDMGSRKFKPVRAMTRDDVTDWLDVNPRQRIDKILLTHADQDHFNYVASLGRFVAPQIDIYHTCDIMNYGDLVEDTDQWMGTRNFVRVRKCVAKDKEDGCESDLRPCENMRICGGMGRLRILAAELNNCRDEKSFNEDSMVVKLQFERSSVILYGDLEDGSPNEGSGTFPRPTSGGPYDTLLSCADVQADLMRLPHHGAYGKANKPALLLEANPKIIFSSSAFRFFHPRCEIEDLFDVWSREFPERASLLSTNQHWYTCGDPEQDTYLSSRTDDAIFVTTVCNLQGAGTVENYIIKLTIAETGDVDVTQTLFSSKQRQEFPEGDFPCGG